MVEHKRHIYLEMTPEEWHSLKLWALRNRVSLKKLISHILKQWLKK